MSTWKREKERQSLWRLFDRNKNVALFAPRRLGKTWLMRTLENEAETKGYAAVFIDLEAETTALGAVKKLCREINSKRVVSSFFSQLKTRMTDILHGDTQAETFEDLLLKADWESMLDATLSALNTADTPCLLLIDEVSVCLSSLLAVSKEEGAAFMRRLREHQQKYTGIRWMLTGSIGLDHVAEQYGLGGTLNQLDPFPLNPLTPEQAKAYVNHLCSRRDLPRLENNCHQLMQNRLGWLAPHYLSRLMDRIEDQAGDHAATDNHIKQACDSLLSYPYNRVFSDWPDHINRNYPDDQKVLAHKVLVLLSAHPEGERMEAMRNNAMISGSDMNSLRNTLVSLENDGFIQLNTDTGRYCFIFGLLREYWKRYQAI
ncbi:MAG: AAA family ATPase [Desulfobacterales bacterium]|nr:AAA family ATPase [Desulfobacterales bacterium]